MYCCYKETIESAYKSSKIASTAGNQFGKHTRSYLWNRTDVTHLYGINYNLPVIADVV